MLFWIGTEEALALDARAVELLRRLSWLLLHECDMGKNTNEQTDEVLLAFHQCRDKQVFRILSTIASPSHSANARQRALEQVPSRIKAFLNDDATAEFALGIVEQTAMPDFMNYAVLRDIVHIAEKHRQLRSIALKIVRMISSPFPRMAEPAWKPLTAMLQANKWSDKNDHPSDTSNFHEDRIDDDSLDLITSVLATSAAFASTADSLPQCILDLCKHGSPHQAQNSIKTIVGFYGRKRLVRGSDEDDCAERILSLMDNLASELSFSKTRQTLTVLASLTALVGAAPENEEVMESASHNTWQFCLKAIHKDAEKLCSSPRRKRGRSPTALQPGVHSLVCTAIEFLVSFIRAFSFVSSAESQRSFVSTRQADIQGLFSRLVVLLRSPTTPETLRECSGLNLCRLCDPRIRLEPTFLTTDGWHALAKVFLDDSPFREVLAQEFSSFLTGGGVYGDEYSPSSPEAPSLRIVSLHIFMQTKQIKVATTHCITILRDTCDKAYSQCRALGKRAEERFESVHKMRLMPEYMVPFAYHLLGFNTDEDDERTLHRRLKLLFEPLVQSLGDAADNISFLLRMTEHMGGNFETIIPKSFSRQGRSCDLQFICKIARTVLLSMVKKDVNLSPYAGQIQVPAWLFERNSTQKQLSQTSSESGKDSSLRNTSPTERKTIGPRPSSMKKRHSSTPYDRIRKLHVQFSPDSDIPSREIKPPPTETGEKSSFGGLSPIQKSSPDQTANETASESNVSAGMRARDTDSSKESLEEATGPPKEGRWTPNPIRSKKRSLVRDEGQSKRKKVGKEVPAHIEVERNKSVSRQTEKECENSFLEFEPEIELENYPNAPRRRKQTSPPKRRYSRRTLRSRKKT